MTTAPSLPPHDLPAAAAAVLFARTHEGVLVAKVGDNAFAMLSGSGGPPAASECRHCGDKRRSKRSNMEDPLSFAVLTLTRAGPPSGLLRSEPSTARFKGKSQAIVARRLAMTVDAP